jgi:hypothetical protein
VFIMALICSGVAAAQTASTALVEKISGGAYIRHDAQAKPVKLDPHADLARRLYPGEQVRCEQGGFLRLRVGGKLRDINGPSGWFMIPRAGPGQSDPLQKVLDEYGRRGGRDRGDKLPALIVFSPSDRSVVRPDLFVIRWTQTKECELSVTIQDADGNQIFHQERVSGAAGVLTSNTARQALRKYRRVSGVGPLALVLADSCGADAKLAFSLLTSTDEKVLSKEIARWQREPGKLTRHLGRAEVLARYGMFPEAATEYEAALAQAARSIELLTRTIVAQRQIGNMQRARELTRRLPAGVSLE